MRTFHAAFFGVALVFAVSGCDCERKLSKRKPVLVVEDGKTSVDFGTVQVNTEQTLKLGILNNGTAALNVSELRLAAPFGVKNAVPLSLEVGNQAFLELTYLPTVPDVRNEGELVIKSDDPEQSELPIKLTGKGIQAVAVAQPASLDFGEVVVGEWKTLTLILQNAGSNDLFVKGAEFVSGTPGAPVLAADLSRLVVTIRSGATAQTDVQFAPQAMGDVSGAIRLALDPLQGAELRVPILGRGVRAIPELCVLLEGATVPTCTSPDAGGGFGAAWKVEFPAACDNLRYPPDAGPLSCAALDAGVRHGELFVRNEGNLAVSYTLTLSRNPGAKDPCDAGSAQPPDFTFTGAGGDGGYEWTTPVTKVPTATTDSKPWTSASIGVTYRATSRCREDAADQALVTFQRSGDNREPVFLFGTLAGQSALPHAVSSTVFVDTAMYTLPKPFAFTGVLNQGPAPLTVTDVTLYEVALPDGGFSCAGPDAGTFLACDPTDAGSPCSKFAWDGGAPNAFLPLVVDGGSELYPGSRTLGQLVFGPNTGQGVVAAVPYCIYAVVTTNDPYGPVVVSKVQARAQ